MAHEEVAPGCQLLEEPFDEHLPRCLVKVDHDVAAEDDILPTGQRVFGLEEVDCLHRDMPPQISLQPIEAIPLPKTAAEVAAQECLVGQPDAVSLVDSQPTAVEHPPRDVGCLHAPGKTGLTAGMLGQHDRQRVGFLTGGCRSGPDS